MMRRRTTHEPELAPAGRAASPRLGRAVAVSPSFVFPTEHRIGTGHWLVVGPGARDLAQHQAAIADWLKTGGRLLALGLDQPEEWDDPYRFFRW